MVQPRYDIQSAFINGLSSDVLTCGQIFTAKATSAQSEVAQQAFPFRIIFKHAQTVQGVMLCTS